MRQGSSFQTGMQVSDKRKRVLQISSGSKSVDGMLGGGFMSQSISEGTLRFSCRYMPYKLMELGSLWGVPVRERIPHPYDHVVILSAWTARGKPNSHTRFLLWPNCHRRWAAPRAR